MNKPLSGPTPKADYGLLDSVNENEPITAGKSKTELYAWLMDILSEYQLPGGKLDGHSLITDLATAKRFRSGNYVLKSEYGNLERLLAEAVGALERIMHARRNPDVPLTNLSRAGMRELAGETLARIKAAKEQP